MMEQYYPEGFIPSTGGSIRVVPMDVPVITLKYDTLLQAGADFLVEVSVKDFTSFPLTIFLEVKNEENSYVYAVNLRQENFATRFKAPIKSGTYSIGLKEGEKMYLFNNRDITVVDCIC